MWILLLCAAVFVCNVPCFHPLDAWQCSNGDVVFTDNLARNDVIRRLSLPCGRCVGCRLERSRQWAVRCMHEASMHMFNSFQVQLVLAPPISGSGIATLIELLYL